MSFTYTGIDHVQLAAPKGSEATARTFFANLLGFTEIEKPESLKPRGGVWFQCGANQVHIGIQEDFVPATKAHPAFYVENLLALREHLLQQDIPLIDDEARLEEQIRRFYVMDPFGNRLEFMESLTSQ